MYRSRKMGIPVGSPELTEQLRTLVGDITEQGIADLLISVVALAREKDLDSESILRSAMANYRREIRTAEGL
jgi:uncharacterized protein YabN with tetrapyrrole methylase and pyrophosphatase domain